MSKFTDEAWLQARRLRAEAKEADDLLSQYISTGNEIGKIIITGADERNLINKAFGVYVADRMSKYAAMEEALNAGDEYGNLKSHSEKEILEGCIALMDSMVGEIADWLEYIADEDGLISLKDLTDEEKFCHEVHYSEIVRRLFLWNTGHSGGTSTAAKCRTLGVKGSDHVTFEIEVGEDEDEDE